MRFVIIYVHFVAGNHGLYFTAVNRGEGYTSCQRYYTCKRPCRGWWSGSRYLGMNPRGTRSQPPAAETRSDELFPLSCVYHRDRSPGPGCRCRPGTGCPDKWHVDTGCPDKWHVDTDRVSSWHLTRDTWSPDNLTRDEFGFKNSENKIWTIFFYLKRYGEIFYSSESITNCKWLGFSNSNVVWIYYN